MYDVECIRCNKIYKGHYKNQAESCDSTLYVQGKSGGYDAEIDSGVCLGTAKEGTVLIECSSGSDFDCVTFRFGRKSPNTLEGCPSWVQDAVKSNEGSKNVCDACIVELIESGHIKFVSESCSYYGEIGSGPCLCDICDELIKNPNYGIDTEKRLVSCDTLKQCEEGGLGCMFHYFEQYHIKDETQDWIEKYNKVCTKCFKKLKTDGKLVPLVPEQCMKEEELLLEEESSSDKLE